MIVVVVCFICTYELLLFRFFSIFLLSLHIVSLLLPTLTLLFESFGFKHGVPLDAELVFDVRCLPNPHYEAALRPLTGRDAPVVAFLEAEAEVRHMREDIARFVGTWLPCYIRDNRNYLTVGIGCTGGQHRSVYFAEWLAHHFEDRARVLVRHRELPPSPAAT